MKVDDAWIAQNIAMITPETAKFLIIHHGLGKLKITLKTVELLKTRAFGQASRSGLDWAERAAGEREET